MPSSTGSFDGASKYLNNLLLARGLLSDGKPIDFSQLASCTPSNNSLDFDSTTTTTRLINLLHDLVLRRDRDAEQRESLTATIRSLHSSESQQLLNFQRLQDKNAQLSNDLAAAEAQQRVLHAAAKKSQNEMKELKEQVGKMKSSLDQVRAKCISDVRRRDVEIEKLRGHLGGLSRGRKEGASGGMKIQTLNIQPRMAGRDSSGACGNGTGQGNSSEWSLENETNDFLAAVVNETSTENVALRKIVGDTLKYLKALTGLDEQEQQLQQITEPGESSTDNAIGIPGQYRDRILNSNGTSQTQTQTQTDALISVQILASSMSNVLSHCQTILRDPSFVPVEEVQARDEEIAKLRAGWEKMADRWKEAVSMMGQWRAKMTSLHDVQQDGEFEREGNVSNHFDADDLSGTPVFSHSVATRPDGRPVLDPIEEEELTNMLLEHQHLSRLVGNQSAISISTSNDVEQRQHTQIHDETLPEPDETGTPRQQPLHIHEEDGAESELQLAEAPAQTIASPARRGIKLHKPAHSQPDIRSTEQTPLSNTNANSKKRKSNTASSNSRKRRSLTPTTEPQPASHLSGPTLDKPTAHSTSSSDLESSLTTTTITTTANTDPLHLDTLTSSISASISDNEEENDAALFTTELHDQKGPHMTVAQKLAVVEAEATEATEVIRRRQATTYTSADRRGKVRESGSIRSAKHMVSGGGATSSAGKVGTAVSNSEERAGGGVKASETQTSSRTKDRGRGVSKESGKDKDRVKKARDRRRSTLTPAELGSLMAR